MNYTHDEIRPLLEGTVGEWRYNKKACLVEVDEKENRYVIARCQFMSDAAFIAASKSIVRQLLEEVRALTYMNGKCTTCAGLDDGPHRNCVLR